MSTSTMNTKWLGQAWRHLAACDSTNDEALAWAREAPPSTHGAVVTADEQRRGRGRLGRRWHSLPEDNLYLSIVLWPRLDPARLPCLTLMAAVAVAESLATLGLDPKLKWPNDVLLDGRKVSGILAESRDPTAVPPLVILGIGVNLNSEEFPADLRDRATSVRLCRGKSVDRTLFVGELCRQLEAWYERLAGEGPAPVIEAWLARAAFVGQVVELDLGGQRHRGTFVGLDPDGALRFQGEDGEIRRMVSGEIFPHGGQETG
jgi:BirA family transcriptional regulator, biotin operon repressor / biotin---[acetyl-CoA-carboxylase] ligase